MKKQKKIAFKKERTTHVIRCEKGLIQKARARGIDVNTTLENTLKETIKLMKTAKQSDD